MYAMTSDPNTLRYYLSLGCFPYNTSSQTPTKLWDLPRSPLVPHPSQDWAPL